MTQLKICKGRPRLRADGQDEVPGRGDFIAWDLNMDNITTL